MTWSPVNSCYPVLLWPLPTQWHYRRRTLYLTPPVAQADDQKIQFILRQTVYFLRETRSAPNAMLPPPVDGIPRPFAALRGEEVGLGLYGLRVERDTLKLLQQSVESMREQSLRLGEEKEPDEEADRTDHPMEE